MTKRLAPTTSNNFNLLTNHEKLLTLVKIGTFAASSHNTQPWAFEIIDNSIKISPEYSRQLKESDPEKREFYLSLGTAFENIKIASIAYGLNFSENLKNIDGQIIQTITFESLLSKKLDDKILDALCTRHNSHDTFSSKPLK